MSEPYDITTYSDIARGVRKFTDRTGRTWDEPASFEGYRAEIERLRALAESYGRAAARAVAEKGAIVELYIAPCSAGYEVDLGFGSGDIVIYHTHDQAVAAIYRAAGLDAEGAD